MSQLLASKSEAVFPLFALGLQMALYWIFWADFMPYPAEDAAMLIRYALHWAAGQGIVWNVGEAPVDGATDFLFLAFVAGGIRLGIGHMWVVWILGGIAHLGSIFLVYRMLVRFFRVGKWLAFVAATAFALGNGSGYLEIGFGTTFFAFWVLLSLNQALVLLHQPVPGWKASLAFAFACLAMGLTRPEGVFMAVFMLAGILTAKGWQPNKKVFLTFAGVFLGLGGMYILWRWQYFGHILPNPFTKKSGGTLHIESLKNAVKEVIHQGIFFLLPLIWAVGRQILTQLSGKFKPDFKAGELWFALNPVLGFTLIWVLIKDEMNILGRFQYPLFCILSVVWAFFMPDMLRTARISTRLPQVHSWVLPLLMLILSIIAPFIKGELGSASGHPRDGRFAVARLLAPYQEQGYTLATTEAGILPLYSGWRTLDTWGLNDPRIVAEGGLTEAYLSERNPQVILVHDWRPPWEPPSPPTDDWDRMCQTLHAFALDHDYHLAACYGAKPDNVHYYYVQRGFADEEAILEGIREVEYEWAGEGGLARDFRRGGE
ncbi:MAG: hypothetical protein H6581_27855 [Bacteroidia bacterium]|nr:hypothetical protein [Bacteroidia bacterium]